MAVRAARAAVSLFVTLVPQGAQAQENLLAEAQIEVAVGASEARVSARYRILGPSDTLVLHAPRFPRSHLLLEEVAWPIYSVDTLAGLLRLTAVRQTAGGTAGLGIDYRIEGDISRIPIFVPEAPTSPPRSRVTITIAGLSGRSIPRDRFPRLQLYSPGTLRANPDHLPSFVALLDSGAAAVPRIAEWSVLAVALAGTLLWLARLRKWRVR
ncbi:hypothetical protein HRbin33_00620 [bacterium HR33]|nr:hypothetical protein HRbin33_00620 [bacterium HR33]